MLITISKETVFIVNISSHLWNRTVYFFKWHFKYKITWTHCFFSGFSGVDASILYYQEYNDPKKNLTIDEIIFQDTEACQSVGNSSSTQKLIQRGEHFCQRNQSNMKNRNSIEKKVTL